ncbi:MAG: uroporphyrinogen-III synthase [Alphaproteobacteria bacterium]|nr:uroporphyrinogen-III synthase [Alphaproteobacteria bacterium]MDE2112982.1 uroporphyrinogen-III synthase [Alphaproteobacteria bacterium]MDE2492317.1 uroporphyrinogen-III synthase [Alphaproteobacteria bacterium]
MTGTLDGLKILVPETRDLDLFAEMLENEGAVALRCPLVGIEDLEDPAEASAWIARLIADRFDDVVLLTGEGLRRLLSLAEKTGCREAFVAALGRVRIITRGPKPVRALREIGLAPSLAASAPTSQGVLDALAGSNLARRRIAVQLYPSDGATMLPAELQRRGAVVDVVTPYRYVSEADTEKVVETIHALAAGKIGVIAFTSSPQVERLSQVARERGLEKELADGLARGQVAAIGPVVEETLKAHGVAVSICPQIPHLKPFVRAIAAGWRKP